MSRRPPSSNTSREHERRAPENITVEQIAHAAEEGRELRAEYRKQLVKMWAISSDERQSRSR